MNRLASVGSQRLKQIAHALLREWAGDVAVSPRGGFVDFDVQSTGVLGLSERQRFRLFLQPTTDSDLRTLAEDAAANGFHPVAILPLGTSFRTKPPLGLRCIDAPMLDRLCQESGVVLHDSDRVEVDRTAFAELQDHADVSLSLLNGLLWLRPLSRNRCPPALRWTGTRPDELFEHCFFLTMTSTFQCQGQSWGSRQRGKPIPDGVLHLPGLEDPVLYDCKASREGFRMEFDDLRACADYLRHLGEHGWSPPDGASPRFLFVSSQFRPGQREASFAGRQLALAKRVTGARLAWVRAPDLVRFGLAIERAAVTLADRRTIRWADVLDVGDVGWDAFGAELARLRTSGYASMEDA